MQTEQERRDIEALSNYFCEALSEEIGDDNLHKVVALNRSETDPDVCHSHDFCDANAVMISAFESCFDRVPDPNSGSDAWVINQAWELSKAFDFNL